LLSTGEEIVKKQPASQAAGRPAGLVEAKELALR
jgi:hypothetical protein